jgi:predicted MFS family arabinose efflux permease
LFLLVLALLRGNADGWTSARTVGELATAVVLLAGFVLVERTVREPMLPLRMFARRDFAAAQVSAFAISSGFFGIYLYLTLYLQVVLHLSPLDAGLATLPGTLLVFVVSGASAPLARRVDSGQLVAAGLAVVAAGVMLITIVGTNSSWLALQPGFLLACLGTGVVNPSLGMLALGAGRVEDSGLLAGTNDAFRNGGIAVGVAAFGVLIPAAAAVGRGPASSYVAGLHHALFLGAAVVAVGAITVAVLLRGRSGVTQQAELIALEPSAISTETVGAA